MTSICKLIVLVLIALLLYFGWWGICYRMPPTAPRVCDWRHDKTAPAYSISFCSSLAENPHGFPGHCYVVWSNGLPTDLLKEESAAFMPLRVNDQIPSVWRNVPGKVFNDAARGNMRNLDRLTVIVDRDRFEATRRLAHNYKTESGESSFRCGKSDCVAFTAAIAHEAGLQIPDHGNVYPQDFIKILKKSPQQSTK